MLKHWTWIVLSLALIGSAACAAAGTPSPTPTALPTPTFAPPPATTASPVPSLVPTTPVTGTSTPPLPTATAAALQFETKRFPVPVGALEAHLRPEDVPACPGARSLEKPIAFSWEGRNDYDWTRVKFIPPDRNWTYYRCDQPMAVVSAFYRQAMRLPDYNWSENDLQEYPDATLLVYNQHMIGTKHGRRWVYLWVFPEASDGQKSNLATVWFDDNNC